MDVLTDNDRHLSEEEERKSFLASASFPKKLFDLVSCCSDDIVRWEEHGRSFRVVDPDKVSEHVLPLYFRHSKLTSFQRQLNLYGFRRITKGEDQGSYYHPKFQRGKPAVVGEIRRLQGKAIPTPAEIKASVTAAKFKPNDIQSIAYPIHQNGLSLRINCPHQTVPDADNFDILPFSPPALHGQHPSGFCCDEESTTFSHNVSDFGWCKSAIEGCDDFDPMDLNILDALFDADPISFNM